MIGKVTRIIKTINKSTIKTNTELTRRYLMTRALFKSNPILYLILEYN
jgi:hypothetical protein